MKVVPLVCILSLVLAAPAAADVFSLDQGGQIEGELLNPDESPRETYVVKTSYGVTVTLARAQVKQVQRVRPAEAEYEKIRPRYPDTIEGQWKLAEWCREQNLRSQREKHLERILELDPNHVPARRALGYSQIGGRWTTRKEAMAEQGMEWYKGAYRTKQEIEIFEEKEKREQTEKDWIQKLERWQNWIRTDRAVMAKQCIDEIRDPAAVKGLLLGMKNPDPRVRAMFVEALARIGSAESLRGLALVAVEDPVEEVRLTSLDHLAGKKTPAVIDFFVSYLRKKDNFYVNRAGVALGRMGDPSAIGPLIDALITVHKHKLRGPPPGQTTSTFGTGPGGSGGPGGMSFGSAPPKYITEVCQNRGVLDALSTLTGVNYQFEVKAWKSWYALQRKRAPKLDARRDG